MTEAGDPLRRVRFYGLQDLSVGSYVPRVARIAHGFNVGEPRQTSATS